MHPVLRNFITASMLVGLVALTRAGTYSLVSGDASLVSGTGTGVSWSVTANTFSATIQQTVDGPFGSPGGTNTGAGTISGTVVWTVDWAESYPGEPVPGTVLVTLAGYGHEYVKATLAVFGSGGNALATLGGGFASSQAHIGGSPGSSDGGTTLTDANHGAFYSGAGSFTYFSPGHYRGTIDFSVNDASTESVTAGMGYVVQRAQADMYNKFTITNIDGQAM
jgi:hypothetical protein